MEATQTDRSMSMYMCKCSFIHFPNSGKIWYILCQFADLLLEHLYQILPFLYLHLTLTILVTHLQTNQKAL